MNWDTGDISHGYTALGLSRFITLSLVGLVGGHGRDYRVTLSELAGELKMADQISHSLLATLPRYVRKEWLSQ